MPTAVAREWRGSRHYLVSPTGHLIRTLPFALLEGGRNCAALNLSAVRVTSSFDPIHFLSSWPVFQ